MKILYIGLHHRWNDARIYYREIDAIKNSSDEVEIYNISRSSLKKFSKTGETSDVVIKKGPNNGNEKNNGSSLKPTGFIKRLITKAKLKHWQISAARQLKPDIVQASDIREIIFAIIIRIFTGCRLIYDSHEDYFNQIYEYRGKKFLAFVKALRHSIVELVFLRFFYCVFCTDEYLHKKYSQNRFGCKKVYLLRNFVNLDTVTKYCTYKKKSHLDLVYIGGVNRYRGVIECSKYVEEFNTKHSPDFSLNFTVYSPQNHITLELFEEGLIQHYDFMDHRLMMERLGSYDVGICLWQKIKKFERNLPIKNFEYMAVGLPIITSNFGNLKNYITQAKCGYCINPKEYTEFEQAILELFDEKARERLGENGIKFTKCCASFQTESADYIKVMTMANPEGIS
ncbi:MAG: glycosyltransferase [Planctomycetota bacterium]|jgi:glycosyltransferase involved in cell wall biosynthesis